MVSGRSQPEIVDFSLYEVLSSTFLSAYTCNHTHITDATRLYYRDYSGTTPGTTSNTLIAQGLSAFRHLRYCNGRRFLPFASATLQHRYQMGAV